MNNELQIISIDDVTGYEKDNVVYLRLDDVAYGLGFTQTQHKPSGDYTSIRWERVESYMAEFGFPHKWGKGDYIPENIVYRLAMKAKNDVAEAFQAKLADEVIPSIRRHGAYMTPETLEKVIADPDFTIGLLTALKEEQEKRKTLEAKVEELKPKGAYYDHVLRSKGLAPITIIAKDYGWSAQQMNEYLHQKKVQFKRNGTWVLYQKFADRGYVGTKTYPYKDSKGNDQASVSTHWTQKGRLFIYDLLKEDDILPVMERKSSKSQNFKIAN